MADDLETLFHDATRWRDEALRIGGARPRATRAARIERARPAILAGKGPHDR